MLLRLHGRSLSWPGAAGHALSQNRVVQPPGCMKQRAVAGEAPAARANTCLPCLLLSPPTLPQAGDLAPLELESHSDRALTPQCQQTLCSPCLALLPQAGDLAALEVEPRSTRVVLGRSSGGLVLFDMKLGKPVGTVRGSCWRTILLALARCCSFLAGIDCGGNVPLLGPLASGRVDGTTCASNQLAHCCRSIEQDQLCSAWQSKSTLLPCCFSFNLRVCGPYLSCLFLPPGGHRRARRGSALRSHRPRSPGYGHSRRLHLPA